LKGARVRARRKKPSYTLDSSHRGQSVAAGSFTMRPMGTLYLVRHGQASFGADDYDQLSELGRRQSVRLGEYLARQQGHAFDAVLTGTLRRHAQTWEGIREGAGAGSQTPASMARPERVRQPCRDRGRAPAAAGKARLARAVPHHFRLLRDGLAQWMAGVVSPKGMPTTSISCAA
jgi:hypothetical protein